MCFHKRPSAGLGLTLAVLASYATALPAATVTIHGRIGDDASGAPVAGAKAHIYAHLRDSQPVGTVETGADGTYVWNGDLSTGNGFLAKTEVVAYSYVPQEHFFDPNATTDVEANFSLIGAAASGIVRNSAGTPLPGAPVKVWTRADGSTTWVIYRSAATMTDGTYRFDVLPQGTYRICAGGLSYGHIRECYDGIRMSLLSDIDGATPLTLGGDMTRKDINFTLSTGASLTGSLVDQRSGDGIPHVQTTFDLYDVEGNLLDTATTNANASGVYRLHGVPTGVFRLAARARDHGFGGKQLYSGINCPANDCTPVEAGNAITVAGEDSIGSIDFSFGPEALIRGRVTDITNSAPVADTKISACYKDYLFVLFYCLYSSTSDAEGRYELAVNARSYFMLALAPDAYVDQVYPNIPCIGESCMFTNTTGIVSAGSGSQIDGIDFSLRQSATLAGQVLNTNTGEPIASANIVAYDAAYEQKWGLRTDSNGRYAGKWLPGTYYVRATTGYGPTTECAFYSDRPCPADFSDPISLVSPTPIPLSAGERRDDIDFVLSSPWIFSDGFESAGTQ